ncbi:MAG: 30S ribosomal protein S21 [Candidatus Latescibacteria bacterium]|nr:30S ribosomal protein S21 [Candidatus Latescibacterota bacterium]
MINFSVEVYADEPFEKALRRFSVKTKKTGLLRDLKKKRFYTKPSVQKKIDKQKSIRRLKKALRLAEFPLAERKERSKTADRKGGMDKRKPIGR